VSTVLDISTARGRTQIGSRAVTQVVSAVAAEALGVRRRQVSVDLVDTAGVIDVTVRASRRALPGAKADAGFDAAADTTVHAADESADDSDQALSDQARTEHTRTQVRSTGGRLTGIRVGDVTVRLTSHRLHLPRLGG
jgi:hypothetical protein